MNINTLKIDYEFHDSELVTTNKFLNGEECKLEIQIIGDHVYYICDRFSIIVIAHDLGNGNGKVISITNY